MSEVLTVVTLCKKVFFIRNLFQRLKWWYSHFSVTEEEGFKKSTNLSVVILVCPLIPWWNSCWNGRSFNRRKVVSLNKKGLIQIWHIEVAVKAEGVRQPRIAWIYGSVGDIALLWATTERSASRVGQGRAAWVFFRGQQGSYDRGVELVHAAGDLRGGGCVTRYPGCCTACLEENRK